MFFNGRVIITFNYFPRECRNSQVFTHSDLEMTLSFAIIGSIAAATLKFVNNARMKERQNFAFKCKKVTNFALSLENISDITVREFIFHYAINSCAYLKRQLTQYLGRAVTKSFLGTVFTPGFGSSILSKNCLMLLSTKSSRQLLFYKILFNLSIS